MRRSPSRPRAPKGLLVTALRRDGRLERLEVSGHAGFARQGEDIVCAAVSALILTATQGVTRYCGAKAVVSDDPDGDYVLDVPAGGNACAQAVLETALSGLLAIGRSYPANLAVRVRRAAAGARGRRTGAARRAAEQRRSRKGA